MNTYSKILILGVYSLVLLAAGAAGGWWWTKSSAPPAAQNKVSAPTTVEKTVLYWYDPMSPQLHFDKPGKSPFMDMPLEPKYADYPADALPSAVSIDPALSQNLGLRLASVVRIPLIPRVEATGIIGFNERDVAVVQSRSTGFVERVWPLAPGDVLKAKQPLVEFLFPEWTSAQLELLAILTNGDEPLAKAARQRLRLLGMPSALIQEVESSGMPNARFVVTTPIAGAILSLDVRAGMTVASGQTIARINGLSKVWLEVAVPEAMAGGVRPGDAAKAQLAAFPEKVFMGRVTSVLPALESATRSLRVRVELPNPSGQLRPGLSAQVTIASGAKEQVLAVPTEAIVRTGKRTLVMLADDQNRYSPTEITTGIEMGDFTVVTAGLSEHQSVVASGQFLIDSEASLRGIRARPITEQTESAAQGLHKTRATITGFDTEQITLQHGPIDSLSMPAMTMSYALTSPELLKGLKAGDKVLVGLRKTASGLAVEQIEKTDSQP